MVEFDINCKIENIRTDIPVDIETARKNVLKILCNIEESPFTIFDIHNIMSIFLNGKCYNNQYVGVYVDSRCFNLNILQWLIDNKYLIQDRCWYTRNDVKIKKLLIGADMVV